MTPRRCRTEALSMLALAFALVACGNLRFGDDAPPSGGTGVLDDDDDGGPGDCCSANEGPECDNPILSACVCDAEPACCEDRWDETCAAQVVALGCGQCGSPGTCCDVHGSTGCNVPAVEACVCEYDPVCCAESWDEQCVADVFLFDCGSCPGTSSCCVADGEPGCTESDVQACVCAEDPTCCTEAWDFQCVQEVETLDCGVCTPREGSSGGG